MAWNNKNQSTKFPWLSLEQEKAIEEATKWLTWANLLNTQRQIYNWVLETMKQQKFADDRYAAWNELTYRWVQNKDETAWKQDISQGRLELLADMTKQKWWLAPTTETNVVIQWLTQMAKDKWISQYKFDDYINWKSDDFLYEVWLQDKPEVNYERENNIKTAWNWAIWVWAWLWVLGSKTVWKIWDKFYNASLYTSTADAKTITDRKEYKSYLKDTEKDLEAAQKELKAKQKELSKIEKGGSFNESQMQSIRESEIWPLEDKVKLLENERNNAEAKIEKLSSENTPTTAETAYKYWIKWATQWQIAANAKKESLKLWNQVIQPKLEKSKATINLKELLNNIDVNDLSVEEWEKADLQRALDMVKNQYKNGKYWNLSVSDTNSLKSALYEEVWDATYKKQKVPWTALKKVRAKVASLLKDEIHNTLDKEFWWNVGKEMKEWWELYNLWTETTKTLEWKSWIIWGKLSLSSAWIEAATTPITNLWWYWIKKVNEWIRNVWKKAVEWIKKWVEAVKEWVKEVKSNPAKAANNVWKVGKNLIKDSVAWIAFEWVVKSWTPENAKNKNANKALLADTFIKWRTKMNSKVYDSIDKSELKKLLNDESFIKYYWEKKINKLKEKLKEKSW